MYSPRAEIENFGGSANRPVSNSADMIMKVHSKPFKSEYDHEYAGGRLGNDPREPESNKRWYVPNYETVTGRGDTPFRQTMSFLRRGNMTNSMMTANFRRYKRIKHPFIDGTIDPEKPMLPYNTPPKETTSRPSSSRPDVGHNNSMLNTLQQKNETSSHTRANSDQYRASRIGNNADIGGQYKATQNVYTMPYSGNFKKREIYNTDVTTLPPGQQYNARYHPLGESRIAPIRQKSDAEDFYDMTRRRAETEYDVMEAPNLNATAQFDRDLINAEFNLYAEYIWGHICLVRLTNHLN